MYEALDIINYEAIQNLIVIIYGIKNIRGSIVSFN